MLPGRELSLAQRRHARAQHARSIRHCPHHRHFLLQRPLNHFRGDRRRYRNHQLFRVQVRANLPRHVRHHLRLHAKKNNVRVLHRLGVVGPGMHLQLFLQHPRPLRMRHCRPGLSRRKRSIAQQRLQQNRSHLPRAQNRNLLLGTQTLCHPNSPETIFPKLCNQEAPQDYTMPE